MIIYSCEFSGEALLMNIKTENTVRIAMCTALISVTAWITVPSPIPFTLQTFSVLLTCGLLGGKNASAAVLIYILLGALGLPVFSGFTGGIASLGGATGGFIIGFLAMTLFVWLCERFISSTASLAFVMSISLLICYSFGVIWYALIYSPNNSASIGAIVSSTVLPFVIPDAIKLALAVALTQRLKKHIK